MFLDREGEAVEVVSNSCSAETSRVIGAYHAIFVTRIRRICGELLHGEPTLFKIELAHLKTLTYMLPDGYFLVLVLRRGSSEATAAFELRRIGTLLLSEIS